MQHRGRSVGGNEDTFMRDGDNILCMPCSIRTIPYHAMPCHAMPYHSTLCHAMTYPVPCILYHAKPCHTIPSHAIPFHAMSYTAMPYHPMLCHAMLCHMPYAICHMPYTIPYQCHGICYIPSHHGHVGEPGCQAYIARFDVLGIRRPSASCTPRGIN